MNTERIDEKAVFNTARKIADAGARSSYVELACAEHAESMQRVLDLLRVHEEQQSFLESPPLRLDATQGISPLTEQLGTQIGPYKLLQQIGAGGMGVVYSAEQTEPVERRVALKIIKPGMDTRQVIARFEAERQALAMMDHPSIAKVLDAGTTESGRPYFVMELVKGVSITEYCDEHHLSPPERLKLFVPVCQAVQHAHQKGIIHRDIKPSNVMVAEYDDRAVPKIIDFGVAKAVDQRLTEKTMFTQLGQVVGTIDYMSPEQAKFTQLDIDTRSDVYSLGVLLYELLTGETPFDRKRLRSAAFDELLRIIREEDPPKPSFRLSSNHSLPSIAANRHIEPKKLSTMVRGELDWIIMKALDKDRTRRYGTATNFSADIERYLRDEPVEACPPSTTYRFKKFARRNKRALATAATVAIALVCGMIGTIWQAVRADAERDDATAARRLADERLGRAEKAEQAAYGSKLAAEQAKDSENELRQKREAQLVRSYVERGLHLADEGDLMGSLIWFAEALKLEQGDPLRALPHRIRLASALRRSPRLVQVWFHTGPMRSAEFSPDGRYVVTRDHENNKSNSAQVWDLAAGELVALLKHKTPVEHASFSPDSRFVVTGSKSPTGEARIWQTTTGTQVGAAMAHAGGVRHASFSPDGTQIVTAGGDAARMWDATTGELTGKPLNIGEGVMRAWFNADGQQIIASRGNYPTYAMQVWDIAKGERVGPEPKMDLTYQWPVAVSRDRQRLVSMTTGRRPKIVQVWGLDQGQLLTQVRPRGVTSDTSISADGSHIVTPCYDGTVPIWDATTGALITSLRHGQGFTAASFSASEREIVTVGNWDTTCRVWELAPDGDFSELGHSAGVHSAAFSPDGRFVVTASDDKTARVWSALTGQPVTPPLSHNGSVLHASFSPDGRHVVTAAENGEARVWDAATGQPVTPVLSHIWSVQDAAFSRDGRRVVTASGQIRKGGEARVWDVATGEPLTPPLKHSDLVGSASFSPEGRLVLTASWDKTAGVWDATTGNPVLPLLEHATRVSHAAFSQDGRYVATSCWGEEGVGNNGTAHVWDAATGKRILPPIKHSGGVSHASFSPDGKRVATASDGDARVWDALTGEQLTPAMPHNGSVYKVEFSGDGLLLVTAGSGGTSRVWDAMTGQPVTSSLGGGMVRDASFSPDGRYVVTASSGPEESVARIHALPRADRPLEDLGLFAQLLSGERIESSGAVVAIEPVEFRRIYERLRSKYPENFAASPNAN